MMPNRTRLIIGGVAIGALATLVAADRAGALGGGEESAGGAREAYLAQAAVVQRARGLVAQADEWRALLAQAREQWESARERMITAPSAEVATARLRDIVESTMAALDLTLDASSAGAVRSPLPDEPVRVIGLSFDFTALNPDVVHRLIDRLENLPDVVTNISSLSVNGPGPRAMGAGGVRVTVELEALAWLGEETGA